VCATNLTTGYSGPPGRVRLGGWRATGIAAEAGIRCAAETIFDVIIDFRGQDRC
jgi:hypothetical protein